MLDSFCKKDSQKTPFSDGETTRCTASRTKSCVKTFFAHLFSHAGLCAVVVGYAVMGAFLFVHLEKDNELATRQRVGDDRMNTLNELYNITGESLRQATGHGRTIHVSLPES